MYEDDDIILCRIIFAIIGFFGVLILTVLLMIPFLNIYIAYKLFGED